MESEEVLSKKYGDCKGLTLFMQAMLSEVGIPSDYTLVKAGEDPTFDEDFPSNQFNHAILRIKSGDKKYWLECTSSHLPAGFLGSFTRNRKVLVITPEGGEVDQTPTYSDPDFNTTVFNSSILLQQNGNAAIKGTLLQKGFPAEITVMKTYDKKEDEITNLFNGQIGGNGLIINDISLDKKLNGRIFKLKSTSQGWFKGITKVPVNEYLSPSHGTLGNLTLKTPQRYTWRKSTSRSIAH